MAANFFAFVLRRYGGDEIVQHLVGNAFESPYSTVMFILFIVFLLGFLLDWIEITIIIMPLMISALAVLLAWRQRRQRLATQKAGGLIVEETAGGREQGAG